MDWHDGDHMGIGWWWVMGIGWLLILALIFVLVVVLLRQLSSSRPWSRGRTDDSSSAERILSERFARGEIDEDDYRRRRDALRG
jgi:putative membrane protein